MLSGAAALLCEGNRTDYRSVSRLSLSPRQPSADVVITQVVETGFEVNLSGFDLFLFQLAHQ